MKFFEILENNMDSHMKVKLFGFIKFSFFKPELRNRKNSMKALFLDYKDNNKDITTFPKATGILRDIQLIELAFLKELDYVCKLNKFDYWLDFGTLLGAVRHKGFIPWDDDVDVSMPREHYEKIVEVFRRDSRNKEMKIDYCHPTENSPNYFIKIQIDDVPIALDIFPYDFYGEVISEEDRIKITEQIQNIRKPITQKILEDGISMEKLASMVEDMKSKILKNGYCTKSENSSLVWGVDFAHGWPQWCWNYDTIYPLSEIEFEGFKFNAPNSCDEYLSQVFGDYMGYPNTFYCGHTAYRLTSEIISDIKTKIKD